ncbi:DUF397 domain-containing protein [Actinomadura sp. 9N215]|uniref:DUF397 domain-containing protein n=1 Tax=Actinomadura sp. 9N215 TaxID=3375150 RepID=UPI0037976016
MWRKSSRSYQANECVEVCAAFGERAAAVRDSKDPGGGVVTMAASQWRALLSQIKEGGHDLT